MVPDRPSEPITDPRGNVCLFREDSRRVVSDMGLEPIAPTKCKSGASNYVNMMLLIMC